jgi:hypothetical protein
LLAATMRVEGHRRAAGAEAADHPALERAQELGLEVEGQLADLVEQHGAAGGGLEQADAGLDRAGEGAALVTEQLARSGCRHRGAVEHHQRPRRGDSWWMTWPRRPCRCRLATNRSSRWS